MKPPPLLPNVRPVQSGFTLIELVSVILIIGILMAAALPKFLELGKDARIASLDALRGALMSAATLGAAKCMINTSCNPSAPGFRTPSTIINGQTIYFHYGYPTGWGRFHVDNGVGGVRDLVDYSGFTYLPHVGGSYETIFALNGAPDPGNCKVSYKMTAGNIPPIVTVSIVSTGC